MKMKPMKALLMAVAAIVVPAVLASNAKADLITFVPNPVSTGSSQSFNVTVQVTTTHPFSGFSLFLNSTASNLFKVTAVAPAAGSPFVAGDFAQSGGAAPPWTIPSSGGSVDLGFSQVAQNFAAGTYDVETLTIQPQGLSTGQYSISTTTSTSFTQLVNGFPTDVLPRPPVATLTVNVPEPASLGVLGLAGVMMLVRRRKAA